MNFSSPICAVVLVLIVAKWAVELWLRRLNQQHVLAHAGAVPQAFRDSIDPPTYNKSVQYTLAKSRLSEFEDSYSTVILVAALFSGILPWAFSAFTNQFGQSAWALAAFLFLTGVALSLPNLPVEWYAQFRLEERFGFNTTTQKVWWLDRVKGLVLGLVLGYPLLALVLKLVEWIGGWWWLWAWGALLAFQLLVLVLAP